MAFDFTNTCSGRGGNARIEHLLVPRHVIVWARHAGVADLPESAADGRPEVLESALGLREAIYKIGSSIAAGGEPAPEAMDGFTSRYARLVSRGRLARQGEHFRWQWPEEDMEARVLGPIVISFANLLATGQPQRFKRCEGEDCGWLFYDTSRNGRRRWCEMQVCGNRHKMQRFRHRRKMDG